MLIDVKEAGECQRSREHACVTFWSCCGCHPSRVATWVHISARRPCHPTVNDVGKSQILQLLGYGASPSDPFIKAVAREIEAARDAEFGSDPLSRHEVSRLPVDDANGAVLGVQEDIAGAKITVVKDKGRAVHTQLLTTREYVFRIEVSIGSFVPLAEIKI